MKQTTVAVLVSLLFSVGIPLSSQELEHGVTVTLKLIQVFVVDRDGHPVTDLEVSDFKVYDNGLLQTITEFERHLLALPGDPREEILVDTPAPKVSPPLPFMNRKFFLFIDFAFNSPKGIMKARDAALHFLDTQLQPSDEVGLISYSALSGVTLHEYLTTDHRKVRSVVEQIGLRNALGFAESLESDFWIAFHGGESFDLSEPVKSGWEEHITEGFAAPDAEKIAKNREDKAQMRFFISGMTDLAKALRYIPGYKFIALFSAGFPSATVFGAQNLAGAQDTWEDRESSDSGLSPTSGAVGQGDHVLKTSFEAMLKELTSANAAIFGFDTQDAEAILNVFGNDSRLTGSYPLERLSGYTGGDYFGHIENYERHLAKMQDMTASYYVLGYPIKEDWNGAYHRVRVEVSRKGCQVRAQRGYYASKPFGDYTDLEKRLHLVDLALSQRPLFQMPLELPSGVVQVPSQDGLSVYLLAKIPGEGVRELVNPRAEIYTLLSDEKDNIIHMKKAEVTPEDFSETQTYYYARIPLPPGEYKGRVVIRNCETGDGARGMTSFTVHPLAKKGMSLFPPLLLVPGQNSRYIRNIGADDPPISETRLSLSNRFPFDPTRLSPLLTEIPEGTDKIHVFLHVLWAQASTPPLAFAAGLASESSSRWASLKTRVLTGTQEGATDMGAKIFLLGLEIDLPDLEPGDYTLHLSSLRTDSNETTTVEVPVVIKGP